MKAKSPGPGKEEGMSRRTMAIILLALIALAAFLIFFLLLAGCTEISPKTATGTPTAVTPAVPSWVEHIAGNDRGSVLLVGRTTCPWCLRTKALLANLTVDYYWVDLDTLDQAQNAEVMKAIRVCGQTSSVPILVINGERCIIGFQEAKIRSELG